MPDTRDRFFAATAAHLELTGIWLRVAGIERVYQDGRRETIPWEACDGVVWDSNSCEVRGDGVALRLDGRLANWDVLGREVADDIAAVQAGERPRTGRARPPTHVVSPEEIRAWLGIEAGTRLEFTEYVAEVTATALRTTHGALVTLMGLLLAFTAVGWVPWLVLLPFSVLACPMVLLLYAVAWPMNWSADEHGLRRAPSGWWARFGRSHAWSAVREVKGRALVFDLGRRELPAGEFGERVLSVGRQVLAVRRSGGALPAPSTVPATALSRLAGPAADPPATALSRTAGGEDG